jgi:uncharacterized protein (DUF1697 family)
MRYLALLRGINVGGNTMIKMSGLKETFESLGFENVVTYINSGNIAFDTRKAVEKGLVAKLEKAIEGDFGKSVAVMMRTQDEIHGILGRNPFAGQYESHKEMHVLFMSEPMADDKKDQLLEKQTADERFSVEGREIFCHLRLGVADSLLGKGFIDKKLKVPITGRNWRTVEKLAVL